mmetsp:Transcript_3785/g.9389  ORF Transcript_3785/g.9389 Transcript_3785/m.9389 type:complete len:597 (-) Transcript_3785:102-1892(-)
MASEGAAAHEARQREALVLLADEVDDPECADLALVCADGQVRVSRRRLARQPYSDYFRRLVAPGFKEAVDERVVLSGAPAASHVRTVCRFLYCGVAELDKDCVLNVLRLADEYLAPDLASDCRAWIADNMSAELAEETLRIGQAVFEEKHGRGSLERKMLLRFRHPKAVKIDEDALLPRKWVKKQAKLIKSVVRQFNFDSFYARFNTMAALLGINHSILRGLGVALFDQRDRIISHFRVLSFPPPGLVPFRDDWELDSDGSDSESESERELVSNGESDGLSDSDGNSDSSDGEEGNGGSGSENGNQSEGEVESDGDGAEHAPHEVRQAQQDGNAPGALEAPAHGSDGGDAAASAEKDHEETEPIDSQAETLKPLVHAARSFCRSSPRCVCDYLEKRMAEGECIFGPLLLESLFPFVVHEPESGSETHPFLEDLDEREVEHETTVTAALSSRILRLTIRYVEENPWIGKKERSAVLAFVPFWKIPPQDLQYLVLRHTTLRECRSVRKIIRKLLYEAKWRKKLVDFVFFDPKTVKRARSPLQDRLDAVEDSLRMVKRERRMALEQVNQLKAALETVRGAVNSAVTAAIEPPPTGRYAG